MNPLNAARFKETELIRGNTEIMNLGGAAAWEMGTGVDLGEPVT